MSSFHTHSIARILNPVARQVSNLILLFEEGNAAGKTHDLSNRVSVVKLAVDNLIKVGHDTIIDSSDEILREDMTPALFRVEEACFFLQDAVRLLSIDPSSRLGKKRLIDGSRGILQGTSAVLVTFDFSEVRKIVQRCNDVLKILSQVEHISSFSELASFVKNATPLMSQMIKGIDERQQELVSHFHARHLERGLDRVKVITPILISSIKLFLNTSQQGIPSACEAQANRDYFSSQMCDEISEIVHTLQLTGSSDTDWERCEDVGLRAAKKLVERHVSFANKWLSDPVSLTNPLAEQVFRQVLESASRFLCLCLSDAERNGLSGLIENINAQVDELFKANRAKEDSNLSGSLALDCCNNFFKLLTLCDALCERTEHHSVIYRLARTLEGKVTQARRWISCPRGPQRRVGYEACRALIAESDQLIKFQSMPGEYWVRSEHDSLEVFQQTCDELQQLADLLFTSVEAQSSPIQLQVERGLALQVQKILSVLWRCMQLALVSQVVDVFTDLTGPVKQLQDAARPLSADLSDLQTYDFASKNFLEHSKRVGQTASLAASNLIDSWRADALQALSSNLESVAGQVSLAGRALLATVQSGASDQLCTAAADHLALLRRYWIDCAEKTRAMVDDAIDPNALVKVHESGIRQDIELAENSIDQLCPPSFINATTSIALRANRLLQVALCETENSEDFVYLGLLKEAVSRLRLTITPLISDAKNLALSVADSDLREKWRSTVRSLMCAVEYIGEIVTSTYLSTQFHWKTVSPPSCIDNPEGADLNGHSSNGDALSMQVPIHQFQAMTLDDTPCISDPYSNRVFSPETDIEEEFNNSSLEDDEPIMVAAHALHQEARLWSSHDNELIVIIRRIASLMARLSQIVRGEHGTQNDLINVSISIAEASIEVTRCAKALAKECTDRRLKANLIQLTDRIITIGNQLRILSTVKATMLDSEESSEDQDNTDVLVGNVQNLMQAVIETVRAAEGASIKMRFDSGLSICWRPREINALLS